MLDSVRKDMDVRERWKRMKANFIPPCAPKINTAAAYRFMGNLPGRAEIWGQLSKFSFGATRPSQGSGHEKSAQPMPLRAEAASSRVLANYGFQERRYAGPCQETGQFHFSTVSTSYFVRCRKKNFRSPSNQQAHFPNAF